MEKIPGSVKCCWCDKAIPIETAHDCWGMWCCQECYNEMTHSEV